ncbi:MAG: cation-transporting P-type ATPase [Chloroflexi bacterium]|nr:cation-transporting P-type ATPase [Chloroflexota bacterium]
MGTEKSRQVLAKRATPTVPYYSLAADRVLAQLESSPRGLSSEQATRRLAQYGPNVITQEQGVPLWRKFVANLTNFFAILLWVAAALSFLTGGNESGVAIIAVILVNAFFSFFQEYRAEQAVAALQRLLPANAKVRRNGEVVQVPAAELVPGDILVLEEGDNISADARVLQEFDLRTNNSTLTGESEPVRKTAEAVLEDGLVWTQMPNLVFAGTSVASGSAEAAVMATGMNTEFGHIAHLTQSVKADLSPLQIQIGRIATTVTKLSVALGVIFLFVGIFLAHFTVQEGAIFTIGIIIANVPEGLLPTLSLALASAVQRLVKRNALVKRLSSVETLGSATVVCTDKTGTLTQNEMTVREVWVGARALVVTGVGYEPKGTFVADGRTVTLADSPDLHWLVRAAAFCNNARLLSPDGDLSKWGILGDPTEGALLVAAAKAGFDTELELQALPRIHLLPFESRRKRMSVIHTARGAIVGLTNARVAFTKGAPREVLSLCTRILMNGTPRAIGDSERTTIMGENDRFAAAGLRVLGLAFRELTAATEEYTPDNVERDLTFIGLMAMQDPPRPEVAAAVENARTAGIRVVMITGDYGLTAESIARKIGIVQTARPRILTGGDLDAMDDSALKQLLSDPIEVIFARVAPEHKLRVVAAFRDLGEIVAVTGDGVNDAPALKRADIGVAMGKAGTDVAKEAAAMILTDDNFASIISAVEEGRAVYDNIRKFVTYIFAHLGGEVLPYVLFALFNLPLPLTALQILAIDLGTETLPALALGTERPEPDVMKRPPRSRKEAILNAPTLLRGYFFLGILLTIGEMLGYFWQLWRRGWQWGVTGSNLLFAPGSLFQREAATMVFLGIVIMQVANVFACRTERVSVLRVGFFSNRLVFAGIAFELIFAAILIYTPFFQHIFGTAPVGLEAWLVLFAFTPLVFLAEEARKWFGRHMVTRPGKERQR